MIFTPFSVFRYSGFGSADIIATVNKMVLDPASYQSGAVLPMRRLGQFIENNHYAVDWVQFGFIRYPELPVKIAIQNDIGDIVGEESYTSLDALMEAGWAVD